MTGERGEKHVAHKGVRTCVHVCCVCARARNAFPSAVPPLIASSSRRDERRETFVVSRSPRTATLSSLEEAPSRRSEKSRKIDRGRKRRASGDDRNGAAVPSALVCLGPSPTRRPGQPYLRPPFFPLSLYPSASVSLFIYPPYPPVPPSLFIFPPFSFFLPPGRFTLPLSRSCLRDPRRSPGSPFAVCVRHGPCPVPTYGFSTGYLGREIRRGRFARGKSTATRLTRDSQNGDGLAAEKRARGHENPGRGVPLRRNLRCHTMTGGRSWTTE